MNDRTPRDVAMAEAVTHLLYHLDGQQVLTEATLSLVLDRLAGWSREVTGVPFSYGYSKVRALQTLSLVVSS